MSLKHESSSEQTVDPVLKPLPVGAVAEHTTGLYDAPDHSGQYYCADPDAGCSTTVTTHYSQA